MTLVYSTVAYDYHKYIIKMRLTHKATQIQTDNEPSTRSLSTRLLISRIREIPLPSL